MAKILKFAVPFWFIFISKVFSFSVNCNPLQSNSLTANLDLVLFSLDPQTLNMLFTFEKMNFKTGSTINFQDQG